MTEIKTFVGRKEELKAFQECVSSQEYTGIYYYGIGGIGKSLLLRKIPSSQAFFIDFFATENRSIEGVQNTVINYFKDSSAFQKIFDLREQLNEVRQGSSFSYQKELASSLQRQIELVFAGCCNKIAEEQNVILLFDSFEYVQTREVGRWFLHDFLPHLKVSDKDGMMIVVAGRPEPKPADMPANIRSYALEGLNKEEIKQYVEQHIGPDRVEDYEALLEGTNGNPLMIELLRWCGRKELLTDRQKLQTILTKPKIMAEEIFSSKIFEISDINKVLWAMATLKRRFDFEILQYLVEKKHWLECVNSEEIKKDLLALPFVKNSEEISTHLLHDIVIEPIALVFEEIAGSSKLRNELLRDIIHEYYPQKINASVSPDEKNSLQIEQLGYLLDYTWEEGAKQYRHYVKQARERGEYDFEESLWGELSEHVKNNQQEKADFLQKRALWLFQNGLYHKLESLGRELYEMQIPDVEVRLTGSQFCGFALMRQGKLRKATEQFEKSLKMATEIQSASRISETENNFGQVEELAGRHDMAAQHYWQSIRAYPSDASVERLAAIYSARGYSLAMKGHYRRALQHCRYAVQIFEDNPQKQQTSARQYIHTLKNMGIIYRLLGDYERSSQYFNQGKSLTQQQNFIELEASLLQEMAFIEHLRGCQARVDQSNVIEDCSRQEQTLSTLVKSLGKAHKITHQVQISKSLLILALVLEEIFKIKQFREASSKLIIDELLEETRNIPIIEDAYWLQQGLKHFSDKSFSELNLLEKVARLYEIGERRAERMEQFYLRFECQVELTRVLLELHAFKDAGLRIQQLWQSVSTEVNEELLSRALKAVVTLLKADLACDQQQFDTALKKYTSAIPILIQSQNVLPNLINNRINNLVDSRLDEMIKRIRAFEDKKIAINWCRKLQSKWESKETSKNFSLAIERIQILLHELSY